MAEAATMMEWMFNVEEKEQQFLEIIERIKEVYFESPHDFLLPISFGKDSSLGLELTLRAVNDINPSNRTKTIHVISSNTRVESKKMESFIIKNLQAVEENCKHLNVKTYYVTPSLKQSFWFNVIAKGLPAPREKSPFDWCKFKMKIEPMNTKIMEILAKQPLSQEFFEFDATMFMSVRSDESIKRSNSINKHSKGEEFGTHPNFPNLRTFYPIKKVTQSDLWMYLDRCVQTFTWGISVEELREMYDDGSEECPIIRTTSDKSCGGNTRNGCFVCLKGGRNDQMLEGLMKSGDTSAAFLASWKAFLYDVSFDIRYREPLRRKHLKAANDNYLKPQMKTDDLFADYQDEHDYWYKNYLRANKGDENGEYRPGPFTVEMRKMLLEKLLWTQEKVQYKLIRQEEIQAILKAWEEDGYLYSLDDIHPIDHQYDGCVVLKPDWSVNQKETTNQSPVFFVEYEFKYNSDELVTYIQERQRHTGKSIFCFFNHKDYPKERVIYNTATFVVCHKDIKTEAEAREFVTNWLYIAGTEAIGTDGLPFPKMVGRSFDAALQYLMLSAIGEGLSKKIEPTKEGVRKLDIPFWVNQEFEQVSLF